MGRVPLRTDHALTMRETAVAAVVREIVASWGSVRKEGGGAAIEIATAWRRVGSRSAARRNGAEELGIAADEANKVMVSGRAGDEGAHPRPACTGRSFHAVPCDAV